MQIVNVNFVLDGHIAKLIGRAVNVASLDAAAGQPRAESFGIVVTPRRRCGGDVGRRQLAARHAAEFASPNDQRIFEHPALF